MCTIGILEKVEFAKKQTQKVANLKDWQCRNQHLRAMREAARELVKKNGGYIIKNNARERGVYCYYYSHSPLGRKYDITIIGV